MSSPDPVSYEPSGRMAVVTMSQHESRNALSDALLDGLSREFQRAAAEEKRALVLRSDGRVFCSGGDLAGVNRALDGDIDVEIGTMVDQFHSVIRLMHDLPMPTIAAIGGPAVGAGVALALAADVRVVARSATFSTGYVAVGASPDGGASFHLARSLGTAQALSSFLLNRRFTSAEIERLGLAAELVEDSDLDRSARALGERLAEVPILALLAIRQLVNSASFHSLDKHLDAEREHFVRVAHTDGFRRGVAQFAKSR